MAESRLMQVVFRFDGVHGYGVVPSDHADPGEILHWERRLAPFVRLAPGSDLPPPQRRITCSYLEFVDGSAALIGRSWSGEAPPGRNAAHAIVGESAELAPISTGLFDWPGWFAVDTNIIPSAHIDTRDLSEYCQYYYQQAYQRLKEAPRDELVAAVRAVLAHVNAPGLVLAPGGIEPEMGVFLLKEILSPVLSPDITTFRWTYTTYADTTYTGHWRDTSLPDGQPWVQFAPRADPSGQLALSNLIGTGVSRIDLTEDVPGQPMTDLAISLVSWFLGDRDGYRRAITESLTSVSGTAARITALRLREQDIARPPVRVPAEVAPPAREQARVGPRPHVGVLSDTAALRDELGMGEEVSAIAALLAARNTAPPLSVAILGDWGTGKSSFMRQVAARVDELALASKSAPETSAYARNIRQVRFNAWHYSDDHLWTGLIEHLFRALMTSPGDAAGPDDAKVSALKDELDIEVAEKARLDHELAVVDQVELGGWLGGLNQPFRAQRVLSATGRSIWRETRRGRSFWLGLLLFLVGVGTIVAGIHFGQLFLGLVAGWVTTMAGLVTPAFAAGQRIGSFIDDQHTKLRLERDNRARNAAKLTERLVQLDPAGRLDNLLAEITSEGRYADYRGLTGRIHHDLIQLDRSVADALALWELQGDDNPPPLQRVVLYIDDLDRCQADRVVAVLQAVNLLLTMRLFVVVVAVDPPWLLNALNQHYGTALLSANDRNRSLDYLDKIFDIPYALRIPNQLDTERYFRALLPIANQTPSSPAPPPKPAPTPADRTQPHTLPAADTPATTKPSAPPAEEFSPTKSFNVTAVTLHVTEQEVAFLARLGPLLVTPRAMKRTTNLYRLLRISNHDDIGNFLGNLDTPGPYQAAALLLATVVGAPDEADSLLAKVTATKDNGHITDALPQWTDLPLAQRLVNWFDTNPQTHTALTTYRAWVRPVARFGFRTYHLYASSTRRAVRPVDLSSPRRPGAR